ncbi:NDP-hexose 2,3-dehydratase family protein [Actinokineospora globicatena]|uniref:NDP-hexose 2,3-dehydratase n=1 Tax=Actinokineospora globicatena TaxID=103729 RepID=A0A9W6QNV6_9PSEU|nr:NDP-hexose 2,3-dehydratase family protein [Actinokineospora globicatena]MCP2302313.1 oxidase EvaA [Actinokineospora globicatena]GLW76017.1 NDP-hexose 2,3-dehydratase [Actinokineospora globicatena]GLW82855.1 NDP-hexose 2,3-dehydratase [Actinokineospora globicatena]GLW91858.1 NDP-hexose 2,3-dehydratase [Actinokineospora globicatena]
MTELSEAMRVDFAAGVARSALAGPTGDFAGWLADCRARFHTRVEPVPLDRLDGWSVHPETGDIGHHSGKFFTVRGLDVEVAGAPVPRWSQPIISQPEIGILGILVREFDGVPHLLMQAKVEPGNVNGVQLSPTVQATRSNYTSVHGGKAVPYLDYFRDTGRHTVLADVRQSEQGAWFHRKRNRNMVVLVDEPVEVLDGFCWLTLAQVHQLLRLDDLVNMDTRTVLCCLPFSGAGLAERYPGVDGFRADLVHALDEGAATAHTMGEVLSWITEARTRHDVRVREIPLNEVTDWRWTDGRISHDTGLFFDVVGVGVTAAGREVGRWHQPMLRPRGQGLAAFLVRQVDGVPHVLMHARVEPGYFDVVELAPTVQCTPDTYDKLPAEARPEFLDEVLAADPSRILFDAVHSEEGGRFMHARTRYVVLSSDADVAADHPDYRWLAPHQLATLLRHSHYLNVQARSVLACLHSLVTPEGTP